MFSRVFYTVLSIAAIATIAIALAGGGFNGGYLTTSPDYTAYNADISLRAMSGVHTCVNADSVAIRPGRKWGAHYILKCLYNNSGATQKYTIVDSTLETGLDTFTMNLAAYSMSFPLPYAVLVSGCEVDSTLYIRQYK